MWVVQVLLLVRTVPAVEPGPHRDTHADVLVGGADADDDGAGRQDLIDGGLVGLLQEDGAEEVALHRHGQQRRGAQYRSAAVSRPDPHLWRCIRPVLEPV